LALVVLCFGVMVSADDDLIRHVYASEVSDFINCSDNFGNGINNCEDAYDNCLATCIGSACDQCGPTFGGCFGDSVHDYSGCLGELDFGMDTCQKAEEAWGVCMATYNHCISIAQNAAQQMDCAGTRFECKERSGIDFCQ